MKRLLFLLSLLWSVAQAQTTTTGYLRYDSVQLYKQGGNSELILLNGSRNIKGLLTNVGNGRTQFIASHKSGDTLFVGKDTITGIGGGTGSGVAGNTGAGFRVWKPGTSEVKTLFPSTGIFIDSTTNTNGLTFKPDTSVLQNKNLLYPNSVEKTGITVRLINDANTDSTQYANLSGKGWQPSAVVDIATQGGLVQHVAGSAHLFTTVPFPSSFYETSFRINLTPNAPASGDSVMFRDTLINKEIILYRDGLKQYPEDTLYGYEWDKTLGKLTVHPPFNSGERVQLQVFTSLDSASLAAAPLEWVDLDFSTRFQISEASNVFTGTIDDAWNHYALEALALTGDGYFRAHRFASDGKNFVLGLNATNSNQDYTNYEYGVYIDDTGVIWHVDNGTPTSISSSFLPVGDYITLHRVGSTLTIETSPDGSSWTVVHTFGATTSATLYTCISIYRDSGTNGKIYSPQGFNLH